LDLLTDNAIMLKVKAGDLDKMGLLFERHHRALYGFLFPHDQSARVQRGHGTECFLPYAQVPEHIPGQRGFQDLDVSPGPQRAEGPCKEDKGNAGQSGAEGLEGRIGGGPSPVDLIEKKQEWEGPAECHGRPESGEQGDPHPEPFPGSQVS